MTIVGTAALILSLSAERAMPPTPTPGSGRKLVGTDAVWIPDPGFMTEVHAACDRTPESFGECFVDQMKRAGASEAALEFARRTGRQGFLTELHPAGPVDIAWAEYPYRANENQACLIVNGDPPWIDVDDLSRLDLEALERSRVYAEIKAKHPGATLFPGSRAGEGSPSAARLNTGGERVTVGYALRECHACAVVGAVLFGFEFGADGRLAGTRLMTVRARNPKNP
jgi:hypothetical protein